MRPSFRGSLRATPVPPARWASSSSLDGTALPRELIPLAGAAGARVEMHLHDLKTSTRSEQKLSVRAVDAAGNRGPGSDNRRSSLSSREPARLPQLKQPAGQPRAGGGTAEGCRRRRSRSSTSWTRSIPSTGELIPAQPDGYLAANHLWDAASRQIKLQAARNEFVAFQILLRGDFPAGSIKPELAFDGAGRQDDPGRARPLSSRPCPRRTHARPDRAAELCHRKHAADQVSKPARRDLCPARSAARRVSSARSTLNGPARAAIRLASIKRRLQLPVSLTVWNFSLPDHLSFLPEMNCYGLPEDELDYYRLAHRHRTVLNRVPYNQNGRMSGRLRPVWDSRQMKLDWTKWDRRFGPLLDGSAFADLPRKSVPVECFYLPLHENWPSPMEGNL